MSLFRNKRKDYSIQPPTQLVPAGGFTVTDSSNIDFTYFNGNLTADLTLTGVVAGTYGSSTQVPVLQIDQWGRVTGVTLQTISTSGLALETNGTPNGDQTLLNLVAGTNMTITDDGLGNITFDASGVSGVTAVTATAPLTSSGGTTPDISTSMNTNKLIGRGTAGVGVMEEITLGTNLSLSGTTLNATGGSGLPKGTASGTDTYTTTISGVTAYNDGDAYLIRFTNGNTTGCTLNINSLGAITLYRNNDGALIGGDILSGAEMLCIYNSTLNVFQTIGTAPNTLIGYVTNDDSVTITKGQVVYAFGGQGDRMTVKLANNTSDATSARTVGVVLSSSIATNQKGLIMMQGLLDGLNILPTATWNDGDPVYLGATAGSITKVKPYAPNHLVYVGIVTTASNGSAGRMYVNIQNGYELDELHNVQAQSPALKDTLWYDNTVSPAQWKTASISTILGYTPGSVTSVSASVPAPASPALSVNVSNPTTTPAIAITANGTTSEYVRGDGSLATFPTLSITPYIEGELIGNNISQNSNCLDILVEPSINRLYVPFFLGNVTYIFNSSTNALVAILSTTAVNAVFYIASVNQLWVTYLSTGNISRFNASTGASAGADITGSGNRGQHYIEYSATKVFIANSASNNITVVNPSTGTVTATIAAGSTFPRSMVLNSNPSSAQNDRIAVVCQTGNAMLLINPATNAITIAATNVGSQMNSPSSIVYDATSDRYIIGNVGNHRLLYINPATATTFTYDTYTDAFRPYELNYDSSTRYVYIAQPTPANAVFNPTSLAVVNAATKQMIRQIVTSSFDSTNVGLAVITIDTTNKYVYLVSYGASSRIIKIKI